MKWTVGLHDEFVPEFDKLAKEVRIGLASMMQLLEELGPHLARPHADTLKGSRYPNMKELRFYADDGVWRFAFAFDPRRRAVVLCGGDKSGGSEKKFYKSLIKQADDRFHAYLSSVENAESKPERYKHSGGKKR